MIMQLRFDVYDDFKVSKITVKTANELRRKN